MNAESPPLLTLAITFLLLMALLALTVGLAQLNLGNVSILITLAIAIAKAALVAFFFMQLRVETNVTRLFAVAGLLWLVLLIGLPFCDVLTRADF